MKKSCRIELYKGIHNRMFYVALGSGIAMILAQVVQTFLTVSKNLPSMMGNKGAEVYGLLYRFIGVETETLGHKLFFMSIPILISLATAWIFFEEKEEGYFGQILCRSKRLDSFTSKYIAAFLIGGLTILVPLLLDLFCLALFCPLVKSNPAAGGMLTGVTQGIFGCRLYYTKPFLYLLANLAVEFLWGGVIGCMSAMAGLLLSKRLGALFIVPALFYIVEVVMEILPSIELANGMKVKTGPLSLLYLVPFAANPAWILFGEMGVMLLVVIVIAWMKEKRYEQF